MPFSLPQSSDRVRRVFGATALALTLAATSTIAQFGVFNEGFEGEIWDLIATLDLPDVEDGDGDPDTSFNWASGIAWVNGEVFVADNYSTVITKFDQNLQPVAMPDADWYGKDGTPTYGWAPNEAISADVVVDGQPAQKALIISDFAQNRIFAFWPDGEHIFTIELPDPDPGVTIWGLNGVALSVGGYFNLTHPIGADPTLAVVGTLAAAWPEYYGIASGGAVIYQNSSFGYNGVSGQFDAAAPDRILTGGVAETGDAAIPAVKALTGVTFDSAGNFYMVDSWTGRLHGYDSNFDHQFAFGTPTPDGVTTLEFEEAYGMTLWPSAAGDRLLITLPYQNAAVVYAPVPRSGTPSTIDYLFRLDGLGAVEGLPHSSAFDPLNGRVAVSDSGDNSVKVFQTPVLAVFDLKISVGGESVSTICGGGNYNVSFSITVPEGRSTVEDVSPVLLVNGAPAGFDPAPGDPSYGISGVGPLAARDVISYTYSFTAPNIGIPQEIDFTASATGSTTSMGAGGDRAPVTDILSKIAELAVVDCGGGNAAPEITASVPMPPEASGWTRIEPTIPAPVSFAVTLTGSDIDGSVMKIAYRATGTNAIVATEVEASSVPVTIVQPGVTTIFFKAQDDDLLWSEESSLTVRLDNTLPSICLSIPPAPGQKAPTEWWWHGPVTIPVLVLDSQDSSPQLVAPFPAQLVGTNLVFPNEGAMQVATLTARDQAGHERVLDSNTTLDVCGPGRVGRNINIDMTTPTASADVAEGPVYPGPLTVTLSGQDPGAASDGSSSEVRYIDHSVDGFLTFTRVPAASVPVELHQPTTLQFRAVDWAGNVGDPVTRTYNVNRAPVADPDDYTTDEDTVLNVAAPGVLGDDVDADLNALSAILVSGPAHGVLVLNANGSFTYTPDANYHGPDSFSYKTNDGLTDSNIASVSITVHAVNDAPVSAPDSYAAVEDTPLQVTAPGVLSNDSDVDSDPLGLTAILVSAPAHGTLVLNADGSFGYTPNANFHGSDTFTYRATDGLAAGSVATATITVAPRNDPPVAVNDFVSTPYGTPVTIAVLANDTASDADDTLAIQSVSNMVGGDAVANANGTVTFTPAPGFSGAAGFSYTVVDSGGLTATADVAVTVGPANTEPICTAAFANADLWPPNHKAFYVTVGGVVDPEGLPIGVTFTSILQDEPTNSVGQGNTMQDGGIEMNGAKAWIRAERSGTKTVPGDGRVYLIGFTATDAGGLNCSGTVRVDVPHDQRGTPATLSPGRWNSITGALVTPP